MGLALRRILFVGLPIAAILTTLVVLLQVMAANQQEPEQTAQAPRGLAVFVEPARAERVTLHVSSQGEARPRMEIDLVPQVAGRLVYVSPSFVDGGIFAEDDVLLRIDDADYRLAVTRAEASVAQALRALQSEQAQADLARRDWEEIGEGAPSPLTLREPQLAEARASLAAARASLEDARLQLARTEIRAPFAGRVRSKDADLGQYVAPGQRLGTIFATDMVEIRLPLSDDDLARLNLPLAFVASEDRPGPAVELSQVVAGQPRTWSGVVARTDGAIDSRTRTLNAIVAVEDPYGDAAVDGAPLAVGMFVQARVEGRVIDDAFVVPSRDALRGTNRIYIANEDGTLSIREARVIASESDRIVLADGVSEGEYVIVSAVRGATEGMRIEAYDAEGTLLFGGPEEEDAGETDDEGAEAEDGDRADADAVAEVTADNGDRS